MDSDMEKGIKIHGELNVDADSQQRATFYCYESYQGATVS
jgi:hypothetical protein